MSKLELSGETVMLYAAKNYENHILDAGEFYNDLTYPLMIKKLLVKYETSGQLKDRLVINHVISFLNVFKLDAGIRLLFLKIDKVYHPHLKAILVFLKRCPENVYINNNVYVKDIEKNCNFLAYLEKNYGKQ